ncbi:T9SS type A sorting domain-containing protein [Pontibacter fetidus]|uniref:T9SS type A sorting domain-containing protein n=1 Tax=Pontibacter fetidus TaxID=2700082 RepID=A0A6B2H357_9BACT|nr:T9SS type A sorting domain-containing protein [Pontibacter fetidus]NDK56528.1 T9SS type A sorting domain-containing protein [Pontibacter fetidus]
MKKPVICSSVLILFFMLCGLTINPVVAQISIPQMTADGYQLKHTYTQDFNALPTSGTWANNSTLSGWYARPLSGSTPTTIAANDGSSGTVGLYSFGSLGSTDKALGGHGANGYGGYYYAARFRNNSGQTIKHIKISYTLEQWYTIKQAGSALNFDYAIGALVNSPVAAITWVPVAPLSTNIQVPIPKGSGNTSVLDGNMAANRAQAAYLVLDVNLAPNQEIMLRWSQPDSYNGTGSGKEYPSSALDDVEIEFLQNDVFYATSQVLSNKASWNTDVAGTGRNPTDFSIKDQMFVVATAGNYKLSKDLTIAGLNSKLILGEEPAAATLTIPFKYKLAATVDIANGSTLLINHELAAPAFGNLAPNSNVVYNTDSTAAPVQGNYGNLLIKGGKEKLIDMPVQVRGRLKLENTGVHLKSATITLENGATIEPTGNAAIIKIGQGGKVKQYVQPGSTRFLPVGSQLSYTPVNITLPAGKAARYISIALADAVYVHYDSSLKGIGEPLKTGLVNKVWTISQEGATSPDAELTFYWNPADELPDFDRTVAEMAYYNGTAWESAGGVVTTMAGARVAAKATASPSNTVTITNARSGMYAIWQPPRNPLPVELTAFTAKYNYGQTVLKWTTASERNSNYFAIETSPDGRRFTEVGQVKAAGFSAVVNQYSFTHYPAATGAVYYRLAEYDLDGTKTYSKVVTVQVKQHGPATIEAYPNPGRGQLYLSSATINGPVRLVLTDMSGKTIVTHQLTLTSGQPILTDLQHLPEGVYLVQLQHTAGRQVIRLVHSPKQP